MTVLVNGLKVIRRRVAVQDVAIKTRSVLGRWAGIAQLLRMSVLEREALVGCASVSPSGQRR